MANTRTVQAPGGGKACTTDAKICQGGSVVGRTGPNCEFAECPSVATTTTATTTPTSGRKACTMEAKLCPDGSAVGRTGPNCEFAPCPTPIAPYKSGVSGTVLLGPTCPVERIPPDPQCAEKPYATAITVTRTGSTAPFVIGSSDVSGVFRFPLPPGSYTLTASGGKMLPRCSPIDVTVPASGYATTTISCDTGIR